MSKAFLVCLDLTKETTALGLINIAFWAGREKGKKESQHVPRKKPS